MGMLKPMKKKIFHVKTGLISLLTAIPLPTLIFRALEALEHSGQFFLMGAALQGMSALLVIALACLVTLALAGIAMVELGSYLIHLNKYDCSSCD